MKSLVFTSSVESVYNGGHYEWDKEYSVIRVVDNEHVIVKNDLGNEDCIWIGHFNNGRLKTIETV